MLQKGSRGEQVKELQKMLREAGYFTYPKDTGYFGDITEKALKDFQKARGIKVDGQYGAASADALTNDKKIRVALANPNLTADQKDMLQTMYTNGDHRINAFSMGTVTLPKDLAAKTQNIENAVTEQNPAQARSLLLGNGGYLDPKSIQGYSDEAMNLVNPYYDELQRKDRAEFDQSIGAQNRAYSNNVISLDQGLQDDVRDFYDREANTGVLGSGSRAERLRSIKNKYNNQYNSTYNTAQNNLFNTRLNYAYQYGDDAANVNNAPITRYNVDPTQEGNNGTTIETGGQYDPFDLVGRQNASRQNAADNLNTNYKLNTASKGSKFFN